MERSLVPAVLVLFAATGVRATAQKLSPADLAARLTGSWTINLALSPSFKPATRSGPGRSSGDGTAYAVGGLSPQRGRSGAPSAATEPTPSAPGDLTPKERVERNAMNRVEELARTIAIDATAEAVTFTDQRSEQRCSINGKSAKTELFEARLDVRCRWDKDLLRQEYSTTRSKLTRTWGVDGNGRLIVKSRIETIGQSVEAAAVFDRKDPQELVHP